MHVSSIYLDVEGITWCGKIPSPSVLVKPGPCPGVSSWEGTTVANCHNFQPANATLNFSFLFEISNSFFGKMATLNCKKLTWKDTIFPLQNCRSSYLLEIHFLFAVKCATWHTFLTEIAILCIPVYSIPFCSWSLSTVHHHTETSDFVFSYLFFLGRILLCISDVEFLSQLTFIHGLRWWDVILMWLWEYHHALEILFVLGPHSERGNITCNTVQRVHWWTTW